MRADPELMQHALRLAELGWGQVQPNPLVGAVVAHGGEVLAEGWHERFGESHAEVAALRAAGERARGATLYVTLEPCNHHGKTPPCTEAILEAGIARVVIGARDPNPEAGGGAARLRAAGLEVIEDTAVADVRAQNAAFYHWHEHGTPFIALKLALTLDGAIGRRGEARLLVTGEAARAEADRLRAGFDAVLVGAGTVRVDDPLLTVRQHPVRVPPWRVVLGGIQPGSRLSRTAAEAPVLVFSAGDAAGECARALESTGVTVVAVPGSARGVELPAVLDVLAARGVRSVLVEGGEAVARSFLGADLVRRLYLFVAPRLLGQEGIRPLAPWPAGMSDNWRLGSQSAFGEDRLVVLERADH